MEIIQEKEDYIRVKCKSGTIYRLYKRYCKECGNMVYVKACKKCKNNTCIKCSAKINGRNRIGVKATEDHKRKISIAIIKSHKNNTYGFRKRPYQQASFDACYNSYKREALVRHIEWDITKDEFRVLTMQNCHYCNKKPSQTRNVKNNMNGNYIYSGLDRVDNNTGYILDNIVPCCKECNFAKRAMTKDDFIAMVKRIYEFQFKRT